MDEILGSLIPVALILMVFIWYNKRKIKQWWKRTEIEYVFKLFREFCKRLER